jgi:hypothetical protein
VLNDTVASLRTDLAKLKNEQQQKANEEFVARRSFAPERRETAATDSASEITTSSLARPEMAPATPAASPGEPASIVPEPSAAGSAVATDSANSPAAAQPADTESQPLQPELLNSKTPIPPVVAAAPPPAAAAATAPDDAKPRRRRNLATSPLRPGRLPPLPPFNTRIASNSPAAAAPVGAQNPSPRTASGIRTSSLPVPTSLKPRPAPAAAASPPPLRPLPFGTPMVKHRTTAVSPAALSLSTAQSVTGLRASWLLLTTRYPGIFAGFQPRYVADETNGTYRLVAGPVSGHAEADRICSELRAQSVTCGVTSFIGTALR